MTKAQYLARERGPCAGVVRAIDAAKGAAEKFGGLTLNHALVHNDDVMEEMHSLGIHVQKELSEVDTNFPYLESPHGTSPLEQEKAAVLGINEIDTACPLVTRVHRYAERFIQNGYSIVYIGHKGHQEALGVEGAALKAASDSGKLPLKFYLIETKDQVTALENMLTEPATILTQTTLSIIDTDIIADALKKKFPYIEKQDVDTICYATTWRQESVMELAAHPEINAIFVAGSQTSSNANRLVEVGQAKKVNSYLITKLDDITTEMYEGIEGIGVTSSASTPETSLKELTDFFKDKGFGDPVELGEGRPEKQFAPVKI